jgi:hypothetical protein
MRLITDALELLTAQHEAIDELLETVQRTREPRALAWLTDAIVTHLAVEQDLFYPVVAPAMSLEVLGELLCEHAAIKRVLVTLGARGVQDPAFPTRLVELAQLVAGHVVWQETELFVTVAETMSSEALAAVGTTLHGLERSEARGHTCATVTPGTRATNERPTGSRDGSPARDRTGRQPRFVSPVAR